MNRSHEEKSFTKPNKDAKKQTSRKEIHENKPVNKKRFPGRKYSHKPSTSKEIENHRQKIK